MKYWEKVGMFPEVGGRVLKYNRREVSEWRKLVKQVGKPVAAEIWYAAMDNLNNK